MTAFVFRTRGRHRGKPGLSPASYSWRVDTTADTTISANRRSRGGADVLQLCLTDVSGDGAASFEVQIDGGGCRRHRHVSSYGGLSDSHIFQVRAIDAAGNVDATPASWHSRWVDCGHRDHLGATARIVRQRRRQVVRGRYETALIDHEVSWDGEAYS